MEEKEKYEELKSILEGLQNALSAIKRHGKENARGFWLIKRTTK